MFSPSLLVMMKIEFITMMTMVMMLMVGMMII